MAIAAPVATAITLASTAVSAGMGVYSAIASGKAQEQQMKAQSEQAQYQAEINRRNQQLAEQEASDKRRAGYEEMTARRQRTAKLIGAQRAALGASGAALDEGSALDFISDTAEQGEIDAVNAYNQGVDDSYRSQLQAWSYGQQAASADANSDMYSSAASSAMPSAFMGAGQAALGGITSMASTWGNYQEKYGGSNGNKNKLQVYGFTPTNTKI